MEKQAVELNERCAGIYAEIERIIGENARKAQNQEGFREQYETLVDRYEALKGELAAADAEKQEQLLKRERILCFLDNLRQRERLIEEFDETIFRATVEIMTVYSKEDIAVRFKDGREMHVDITQQ